jgi:uncharacterized phage infection (PIP) family protein YhgE
MAIPTVEEAAKILLDILDRISQNISDAERSKISDELLSFADPASYFGVPASPPYEELRERALEVSDELDKALSSAALDRIRNRAVALTRYLDTIKAVTDEAEKRAKALKLEIIRSAANIVTTAQEAEKAFKDNRSQDGYDAIKDVIDQIENLRKELND